jgi:hypothetical protein
VIGSLNSRIVLVFTLMSSLHTESAWCWECVSVPLCVCIAVGMVELRKIDA